MILKIDSRVWNVDLTPYYKYVYGAGFEYFDMSPGKNHCKLLAYLSQQLPKGAKVADLGTLYGQSALSLATNPDIHVWTFDIEDQLHKDHPTVRDFTNVRFFNANCLDYIRQLADFSIIFLDIAPHDGVQERKVYDALLACGFRGLLICDDIFYSPTMRVWWDTIPLKKYDVSLYGHWSGTGIVVFDSDFMDITVS